MKAKPKKAEHIRQPRKVKVEKIKKDNEGFTVIVIAMDHRINIFSTAVALSA